MTNPDPSDRLGGTTTATSDPSELVAFYDASYAHEGARALLYSRWRALGAVGKADHVVELCSRAGLLPTSTLDVGCGDGALLSELHARGFGGRLCGVEITQAAVEIAGSRLQIDSVEPYDGQRLRFPDGSFELGILSHVLEHVPHPAALLAEVARACRAVVVEVPLEDNLSARRNSKRQHAQEVGHLQRLSRAAARSVVSQAGLRVADELEDSLPRNVHCFFAPTPTARAAATGKWGVRRSLHLLAPPLARRLFTVHHACLALPSD